MIQNQFCSFTYIFMFTFTQIGSGRLVNNDNRKIKTQKKKIVIMINKEKSLKYFKNFDNGNSPNKILITLKPILGEVDW